MKAIDTVRGLRDVATEYAVFHVPVLAQVIVTGMKNVVQIKHALMPWICVHNVFPFTLSLWGRVLWCL